ncbi:MAG: DUF4388 domain-containing protein [candidate division WOR-3 bacterium]|nr:DUF4388 domain-containing protein [candidate division WOR-3 bacterium]
MPIEGNLKSINFASILQLIAQERLTGVLKIKRKTELVDIGFIEGQITGAFFEKGEKVERLENYLVRSGFIKKNLYDMIKEIHEETKRPIMNIIIDDKYLTMEEVERIIKFKIQEVIDEVFTWQDGEFKFEEGAIIYPKSLIKIRLNTENIVLESARRFDEWPRIVSQIPSPDLVFKKVERPELKLKLPEDELRVLSLVDGHRSVNDLVDISGLGKFHTYSCLYHLLTTGQIELAYAKPTPKVTKPKKEISLKFLTTPATILLFFLIIFLEILIGNVFVKKINLDIDFLNIDYMEEDLYDYKKVFFYKNNRLPSDSEVKNIFKK